MERARHGSKCDGWEAVVAERGSCHAGHGGTAGRLTSILCCNYISKGNLYFVFCTIAAN